MSLRHKIFILSGLAMIALIIVLYQVAIAAMTTGVVQLEEREMRAHMLRVRDALAVDQAQLEIAAADWAYWDDTYHFVKNGNAEYVKSNLNAGTFLNLQLNLIVLANSTGTLVYAEHFDLDSEKFLSLPAGLSEHLAASGRLLQAEPTSKLSGLLALPDGIMLITALPILTSDNAGPVNGTLLFGRWLSASQIARLAETTHLPVTMLPANQLGAAQDLASRWVSAQTPIVVRPLDSQTIAGDALILDVFNRPALIFQVEVVREIYQLGQNGLTTVLYWLIILGAACFGIIMLVTERLFLARLSNLSASVQQISAQGNIASRITVQGQDELTHLGHEINKMLVAIQQSQQALAQSEEKFSKAFRTSPDLIIITRLADGKVVEVNDSWEKISGYMRTDLLDNTQALYVDPAERERIVSELKQNGHVRNREVSFRAKAGHILQTQMSIETLELNGVAHALSVIRDVTQEKRAAELTERQAKRIATLHHIDLTISTSHDLQITLDLFLNHLSTELRIDAAAVLLFDPQLLQLNFAAGHGFHTSALQQTQLRLGQGYAGRAALNRQLVFVPDLATHNEFNSPFLPAEGFVTYFALPLIAKGQLKGVLEIFQRALFTPDQEWTNFLHTLATQAAIAIDNAQLVTNLERSNFQLANAYNATIEGWAHALDLRDHSTNGHTQRVADLAMRLANAMGLTEAELVHFRRGAILHDIGKMGIPDAILNKPGPLDANELAIMRKHPQYAFDLLHPIEYLRPALDVPYCHHERWDGKGYPRGLKGEEIPLVARIFAVIDVWDALTSDRPYRAAWSREQALAEIRVQAGTQFDPNIVNMFLQVNQET